MERRLVAILAADVVGYSALMERDEAGTFARLRAGRKELFEPEVERHHGRIFKVMGDGMLAEFGSVVDAVECAVSMQRGLVERNAHVPEGERVQVRIGVNLGEVIVEGDDRFGEGVNIAARLEQLAEPGGICVSGKVAKEVEKKLAFGFEPMGEQKVKNIAEPVVAFRVRLDGTQARSARRQRPLLLRAAAVAAVVALALAGGAAAWFLGPSQAPEIVGETKPAEADGRPALVVLPFANLSDDKEQGYLADGITEDLTTELARVPNLFVISRTAAFTYKGKNLPPKEIARELGVRYILEGSARRTGDDMRVNAQLIDTETGGHVWDERFDGAWSEVFTLQDKVIESVAGALKLRLVDSVGRRDIAGGTANPAAYDLYLRGTELYYRKGNTPEEYARGYDYYKQAWALDPDFGAAVAQLAWMNWDVDDKRLEAMGLTWNDAWTNTKKFLEAAALHPSVPYYQLAADFLVRERRSDEAIALLHKAVVLDPSDPGTYLGLCQALIFNGNPKEARTYLDAAMRVDPDWTDWRRYQSAHAAFQEGRLEDAIAQIEKIDPESGDTWSRFYGLQILIAAYSHLGRSDEMTAAMANFRTVAEQAGEGGYDRLRLRSFFVYKNESDITRLLDGMAKAGMPESSYFDLPTKDRLSEAEIRAVFFGHEVRGRRIRHKDKADSQEIWIVTSADGATSLSISSTSIGSLLEGILWTQAGYMCVAYKIDITYCFAVFRNPSRTSVQQNEYVAIGAYHRLEFSVVK